MRLVAVRPRPTPRAKRARGSSHSKSLLEAASCSWPSSERVWLSDPRIVTRLPLDSQRSGPLRPTRRCALGRANCSHCAKTSWHHVVSSRFGGAVDSQGPTPGRVSLITASHPRLVDASLFYTVRPMRVSQPPSIGWEWWLVESGLSILSLAAHEFTGMYYAAHEL